MQLPNPLACDSLRIFSDYINGKIESMYKNVVIKTYGEMAINLHILGLLGWAPD
jgi:hypothetical protein